MNCLVGGGEKERGSDIFILQYLRLEKPDSKCLGELSIRGEKLRKKDNVEGTGHKGREKDTGKKMRKFVPQGLNELEQNMEKRKKETRKNLIFAKFLREQCQEAVLNSRSSKAWLLTWLFISVVVTRLCKDPIFI